MSSWTVHPRGELCRESENPILCESIFLLPNKYVSYKKKKGKWKRHYIRAYHRHVCVAMDTTWVLTSTKCNSYYSYYSTQLDRFAIPQAVLSSSLFLLYRASRIVARDSPPRPRINTSIRRCSSNGNILIKLTELH